MTEIKVMKPDNLLEYQKGYTPYLIEKLIFENQLDGLRIFDHLDPIANIDFLNECIFLKGLSIATINDLGFEYLEKLTNLTFFSTQVHGTSKIDLKNQVSLERLNLQWRKNIWGIENCKKLTRLGLVDFNEPDLMKISSLNSLEILTIKTSAIKTLDGIESLRNLKKIVLGNCKRLRSITALNVLNKLELLEFDICPIIGDFSALNDLQSLEELHLLDCKEVKSINFLNHLPAITQLSILGNTDVIDGDMTPAKKIKRLSYYHRKHYNERIPTPEADEQNRTNINKIKEQWGLK